MFCSPSSSFLVQVVCYLDTDDVVASARATVPSGLVTDIEAEIAELAQRTREARRKKSRRSGEQLLLRLASTGLQALGRNIIYGESQTVSQGDDDEEQMARSSKVELVDYPDMGLLEMFQFVPQLPGEALFTVPASYWLQVVGR